jgi:hypothetical protein
LKTSPASLTTKTHLEVERKENLEALLDISDSKM